MSDNALYAVQTKISRPSEERQTITLVLDIAPRTKCSISGYSSVESGDLFLGRVVSKSVLRNEVTRTP